MTENIDLELLESVIAIVAIHLTEKKCYSLSMI